MQLLKAHVFILCKNSRWVWQNLFKLKLSLLHSVSLSVTDIQAQSWLPKHTNFHSCHTRGQSRHTVSICGDFLFDMGGYPHWNMNCMIMTTKSLLCWTDDLTHLCQYKWVNCEQCRCIDWCLFVITANWSWLLKRTALLELSHSAWMTWTCPPSMLKLLRTCLMPACQTLTNTFLKSQKFWYRLGAFL